MDRLIMYIENTEIWDLIIAWFLINIATAIALVLIGAIAYKNSGSGLKFSYWIDANVPTIFLCSWLWPIAVPFLLILPIINLMLILFDIDPIRIFD